MLTVLYKHYIKGDLIYGRNNYLKQFIKKVETRITVSSAKFNYGQMLTNLVKDYGL